MTSPDLPNWRRYTGGPPHTDHVHLERLLPHRESVVYEKLLASAAGASVMAVDLDLLEDLGRKAGLDAVQLEWLRLGAEQDDADLRRTAVQQLDRKRLPIDVATALRLVGKDHEVRSEEAWACVHTDSAVADLFAYLNEQCHGHSILGRTPVDVGEVVVLDLRPAIRRMRDEYSS